MNSVHACLTGADVDTFIGRMIVEYMIFFSIVGAITALVGLAVWAWRRR